jgi:hypothetical protein
MTTIQSFINRLAKIGIQVQLVGNFPWVYLDTVNGKKVQGTLRGNHGFTVFFLSIRDGQKDTITDIPLIFKKIRETL